MNLNMRKVVMAQKSHQITSAIEKAALEHQKTQRELEKERRKEVSTKVCTQSPKLCTHLPSITQRY